LSYSGNLLMENRNGLIAGSEVFEANGTAERDAALVMLVEGREESASAPRSRQHLDRGLRRPGSRTPAVVLCYCSEQLAIGRQRLLLFGVRNGPWSPRNHPLMFESHCRI
jgi:hypothetical protein